MIKRFAFAAALLAFAAPAAAQLADLEIEVLNRLMDRAENVASTECPTLATAADCPSLLNYAARVNGNPVAEAERVAVYLVASQSGTFTGCDNDLSDRQVRAKCQTLPSTGSMDTLVSAAFDEQAQIFLPQ